MKLKTLCIALSTFSALFSAQTIDNGSNGNSNIIKTNLTAYVFKNINLGYERIISKRSSAVVSYNFVPEGKIPFLKSFADGEQLDYFRNANVSYSAFSVEYRLYLNKVGFGSGFYLSPYYRYSKVNLNNANFKYRSQGFEIPINLSGDVNANSFGLKTGYQWLLGEKDDWVLDFTIIGGHYGSSNGNLVGTSPFTLNAQQQADLQVELNNLDVPIIDIDATATANGATAKISGPWAGLQFGLALGYRF